MNHNFTALIDTIMLLPANVECTDGEHSMSDATEFIRLNAEWIMFKFLFESENA